MRKEYEDIVRTVCKLANWKLASDEEREGAVGVACVLAYRRGVKPTITDLASHIGLSPNEVEVPFKRLLVNGIFSNKFDVKNDPVFDGASPDQYVGSSLMFTAAEQTRNALATIAGIAGGLTGLRETNYNAEYSVNYN